MKKIQLLTFGLTLFLCVLSIPLRAQVVNGGIASATGYVCSDDNEDGVVKLDANRSRYDYVQGQVLVKFKDENRVQVNASRGQFRSTSVNRLTQVLQKYGAEEMEKLLPRENPNRKMRRTKAYNGDVIQERDLSQLYRIRLSDNHALETMALVDELKHLDEVEFAEPNYLLHTLADDHIADSYSGNPMVGQQWYLDSYGVKELWSKPVINKARPVIAIIDTGVDITHPDLKDNIWTKEGTSDEHGYDFVNNTTKIRDNNKHGTHVAGIAAAANNGIGIVGANPRALIMPITVMQSDGSGDIATIVKGIDYAVKNGANVLNMSIGTYANSSALRQALEKAYQSAVIVAAAGNDGRCIYSSHLKKHDSNPCFPAAYSFVLGVQATTPGGGLASFSNYDDDGPLTSCESTVQDPDGFNYEMKAPGTGILSCIPGGRYEELQGTSMASPLVAGAISALMMVKQYDNQEILWGDLLHTNNIAGAYNVKERPAELDVMKIEFRDRNEQTEYDENEGVYLKYYEVNVGETLNIYPVIRSSFGKASHIKLKISAPSGVGVLTQATDFGYNLDAFGKMTSKNPLVIKVPNDMPNASTITINVQATCNESEKTASASFELRVCNMYTLKGLLTEDMTLTPNHVYYVSSNLGVSEGVTLTIEPGTRLEFAQNTGLYGFGNLVAKGTPERPIIFASHNVNEYWNGISLHETSYKHIINGVLYTNSDSTLFTLSRTGVTPNAINGWGMEFWYDIEESKPKDLNLQDYLNDWSYDLTGRTHLLTDPNYLTPSVLRMLSDWNDYYTSCSTYRSDEKTNRAYVSCSFPNYSYYAAPDTISYCRIENSGSVNSGIASDCIFNSSIALSRTTAKQGRFTNIVNQQDIYDIYNTTEKEEMNYINNYIERNGNYYMVKVNSREPQIIKKEVLPYFGTSREDILRPFIYELGNAGDSDWGPTYGSLDLSNMRKEPYHEAHGIVWKILVNGKDAQDEQEELLPLGVGKHKFEVYFNRPMNKLVKPIISFGPIMPYSKQSVSEDCSWNNEGTIYTAYVTIDGKTQCDGMNRIYVRGAEDNEFFPCPYEASRFNIMVQAAGSMASGFQADAGLGCVNLKWNNENNDFEDAMGFNVYRYTEGENGINDTIRVNEETLDISATNYVDDNVIPGQTYYYYYKVLSTALQEYDVSNVVAATPLTATRGDANGSGSVDVADVVTTVNYVTGLQPKPFVFDAADMNSDKLIDIFDVVGIIRGILNPSLLILTSQNNETATYTIENGMLFVETPMHLGGVQVQLTLDKESNKDEISVASDLDGFETASAWLSDNDYLFLAYSMNGKTLAPGKHALLYIGDAEITSLRLSDASGKNINVNCGDNTTGIDRMGKHVMNINGVYDLQGRKLSPQIPIRNGVYIINGNKVVK